MYLSGNVAYININILMDQSTLHIVAQKIQKCLECTK